MDDKILKLTNSVYKILEFFPESDPLKHRAKDKALEIMADLGDGKAGKHTLENIDVMLGYLWIAKQQGWINSVNFLIVSNEYEKIKSQIPNPKSQIPTSNQISNPKVKEKNNLTERQKQIINYLNKNKKGQVANFQAILSNVTKRTIRRDLDVLLGMGEIVREGDFNQVSYKIS